MEKKLSKREVKSIKFNNPHELANVCALTKYFGLKFTEAKKVYNSSLRNTFVPFVFSNKLSTDDIKTYLDEYQIEVTIICN